MIDALNAIGPVNLELIDLDEPRERAYWARVLSLSENELAQIDRTGSLPRWALDRSSQACRGCRQDSSKAGAGGSCEQPWAVGSAAVTHA